MAANNSSFLRMLIHRVAVLEVTIALNKNIQFIVGHETRDMHQHTCYCQISSDVEMELNVWVAPMQKILVLIETSCVFINWQQKCVSVILCFVGNVRIPSFLWYLSIMLMNDSTQYMISTQFYPKKFQRKYKQGSLYIHIQIKVL